MWLFGIKDTYNIYFLFLIISLIAIRPLPFRCWSSIDVSLSVITLYDIMSCFYGTCTFPAMHNALLSVTCLIIYLILRKLFSESYPTQVFLLGSYLPIIIVLVLTICSFFIFRDSVLAAGFNDTYHFRFLFRPLGYLTNQWAEVLLVLLGWGCLTFHRFSSLYMFLMICAILLSFSRGAYIALAIYLIGYFASVMSRHEKFRIVILCLIAFIGIYFYLPNEIRTTLSMNITVSQQQSTEARINSAHAAWNVFKDNKTYYLFGQGSGSYSFAVDQVLNQDSTKTSTTLAPNLAVLLLIEKGIIGLLLYLFLVFNICRYIYRYRKKRDIRIISCIFLALMAKEMTQANLFCVPFIWLMFYTLLAFLQRRNICQNTIGLERYVIPIMATMFYLGWLLFIHFYIYNEFLCAKSFAAMKKNEMQKAIKLMEKTKRETPYLIQRGRLYIECYQKTKDTIHAQKAKLALLQALKQCPKDMQIKYLQARLYLYMKENNKAETIGKELVKTHPKNSLYLLVLWESLYKNKQKNEALPYLIDAIRYTPRILTMKLIQNLQNTDSFYFHNLRQQLFYLTPQKQHTPTDMARLGYIANWCGNQVKAKKYLKEAITSIPNLSTPWRLLGEEEKYRLLTLGAFQKEESSLPNELEMNEELLFTMRYETKFWNWYRCKLRNFKQ